MLFLMGLLFFGAPKFLVMNADDQQVEIIGWGEDESNFALTVWDIRSPSFAGAADLPKGCEGYAHDGAANVVFYANMAPGAKFPYLDGRACTDPASAAERMGRIEQQIAQTGMKPGGTRLEVREAQQMKMKIQHGQESFTLRFEVGEQDAGKWPLLTKIYWGSQILEWPNPGVRSATKPEFGIESAFAGPSGNTVIVFGYVKTDAYRAVAPIGMFKKDQGRWKPIQA